MLPPPDPPESFVVVPHCLITYRNPTPSYSIARKCIVNRKSRSCKIVDLPEAGSCYFSNILNNY